MACFWSVVPIQTKKRLTTNRRKSLHCLKYQSPDLNRDEVALTGF